MLRQRMAAATAQMVRAFRNRMDVVRASFVFRRPEELVRQRRQRLDELGIVVLEETADGGPPTASASEAVSGPCSAVVLLDDEQL